MADHTPRQASRLWLRRYGRPRAADGTFASGAYLFTRYDGQTRWLRHNFDPVDPEIEEFVWATERYREVLRALFVVVLAALLMWWFW